ncbi:hypothetical protein LVT00_23405, partial [Klebsiella variicola subsp. variicola]|uniref:hypothetical protein n=1 Tax=Klebsiella variicola TaxID=244366 RepID=UPI001E59187F
GGAGAGAIGVAPPPAPAGRGISTRTPYSVTDLPLLAQQTTKRRHGVAVTFIKIFAIGHLCQKGQQHHDEFFTQL